MSTATRPSSNLLLRLLIGARCDSCGKRRSRTAVVSRSTFGLPRIRVCLGCAAQVAASVLVDADEDTRPGRPQPRRASTRRRCIGGPSRG